MNDNRYTLLKIFLQEEWLPIERDTAIDRAILYIPWANENYQVIYQLARRFLFPNGRLAARILPNDQLQLIIRNEMQFNWRIVATIYI